MCLCVHICIGTGIGIGIGIGIGTCIGIGVGVAVGSARIPRREIWGSPDNIEVVVAGVVIAKLCFSTIEIANSIEVVIAKLL